MTTDVDPLLVQAVETVVREKMREWWDEICNDTGCHPDDIVRDAGRRLHYQARHWTDAVARFSAQATLALPALQMRYAVSFRERVAYEDEILAAEMRAERLKRLVRLPIEAGGYVGDTYFPVGGSDASHRWDGEKWEWLPELCARDVDLPTQSARADFLNGPVQA